MFGSSVCHKSISDLRQVVINPTHFPLVKNEAQNALCEAQIVANQDECDMEVKFMSIDAVPEKTNHLATPDMQTEMLCLVTTTMPFGKHKGVLIADLPGNYLNWFAREGFPNGSIGKLLALMQEIDHNGLRDILKPLRNNHSP